MWQCFLYGKTPEKRPTSLFSRPSPSSPHLQHYNPTTPQLHQLHTYIQYYLNFFQLQQLHYTATTIFTTHYNTQFNNFFPSLHLQKILYWAQKIFKMENGGLIWRTLFCILIHVCWLLVFVVNLWSVSLEFFIQNLTHSYNFRFWFVAFGFEKSNFS